MEKIEVYTAEQIEALGSALTFEGLNVDDECLGDLFDWIEQYTPVTNRRVYITLGSTMNKLFGLTGTNAYPADLHIVSVDLQDIENSAKIALPRFEVGGRWLDDIIENNLTRERSR